MIKIVKQEQQAKENKFPVIMDWSGDKIVVLGESGDGRYYVFNITKNFFVKSFNLNGYAKPTVCNEPVTIQNV